MNNKINQCFLTLLLFALSITAYSATSSIRQDSVRTTVNGNTSKTTFYIYAPETKSYYIKFWVMGVKHSDGSFSSYSIRVDNGSVTDSVVTNNADWKMRTPMNSLTIYLSEGYHEISLEGTNNDIPNAEGVASYSYSPFIFNNSIYRDNEAYAAMKSHTEISSILGQDYFSDDYRQISYQPFELDTLSPPFHYNADLNKKVFYTFFRLEYFTQGQSFNCVTTAADTLTHVIHLFNLSNNGYSFTSSASSNGSAYLNCTIPHTGFYYVLIRTTEPGLWGTCNVNVNGSHFFENVPICCSRTEIPCPESDKIYSCFATSDYGDPIIMLMESGNTGSVLNYNDDYQASGNSDFYWDKNARIDGPLCTGQWIFTTMKSYPSLNYKKCDIYTRCQRKNESLPGFNNYKTDDIMYSSLPTLVYNCISWAVGDWIYGYWLPNDDGNEYVDSIFTAYGYYSGETESKARIDLWAVTNNLGIQTYTHGSVRSKRHEYAGGYSWESKLGPTYRVFHPRYSIANNAYGEVIDHYGKVVGNTPINPQYPYLLNINLTQDEFSIIEKEISLIPQSLKFEFDLLYSECNDEGTEKVTIFIDAFEKTDSYSKLLDYCKKNKSILPLIYERICKQEILSVKLLKDIVLSGKKANLWQEVLKDVRQSCQKRTDGNCLHNAQTYAMLLVKRLLEGDKKDGEKSLCMSYSNSPIMQIRNDMGQVTLTFNLDSDAFTSIIVGCADGTMINCIMNQQKLKKGSHSVQFNVAKAGVYTIGLIINGSAYKKTVTVK